MNESVSRSRGPGNHETAARRRDLFTLLGWKNRPRKGKIARLPDALRLRVNQMLQDGLAYGDIIRRLHREGCNSLPYPVSEMNLSNWFHGGFHDWQRQQLAPEVPPSLAVAASFSHPSPSSFVAGSLHPGEVKRPKLKLLRVEIRLGVSNKRLGLEFIAANRS
jgi:hypothetical protein